MCLLNSILYWILTEAARLTGLHEEWEFKATHSWTRGFLQILKNPHAHATIRATSSLHETPFSPLPCLLCSWHDFTLSSNIGQEGVHLRTCTHRGMLHIKTWKTRPLHILQVDGGGTGEKSPPRWNFPPRLVCSYPFMTFTACLRVFGVLLFNGPSNKITFLRCTEGDPVPAALFPNVSVKVTWWTSLWIAITSPAYCKEP